MLFEWHGPCDLGERVELSDGGQVKRLAEPHKRDYLSIFGHYELERRVYGSREGQKIEYVPLDARLGLPKSTFSYLLQDWGQSLAVDTAYAQASEIVKRLLNQSLSINSLERTNRNLSESAEPDWDTQVEVEPAQAGQLVVGTADCKGVVIRKTAQEKVAHEASEKETAKPASLESSPPKSHSDKKKRAVVGAAYTVEPNPRTPDEVLESLFRPRDSQAPVDPPKQRPKPLGKHLRTSLQRDAADTLLPAREEIFSWLAKEYAQRNPSGENPQILLMDGEEKLWDREEQ